MREFIIGSIVLVLGLGVGGCASMKTNIASVEVHGHRGSRGTHPENTIPAFKEAVAAGAQVLELDMQLTQDDVVVVAHDPLLEPEMCRDAKGKPLAKPVPIRTLTLKQLKTYDCGSSTNPRFPDQHLAKAEIPSLEEVLQYVVAEAPAIKLNVETKMVVPADRADLVPDPEQFAEKVITLLRKYGRVPSTILQSFDFRTLEAAKKLEPALKLSCLFETEKDFCQRTLAVGATVASPNLSLVTEDEVRACHAKGIQVVPWTANKPEEWDRLLSVGVDAIITDYPRHLVAHIQKKKNG